MRISQWVERRGPTWAAAMVVAAGVAVARGAVVAHGASEAEALAQSLAAQDIAVDVDTVTKIRDGWFDEYLFLARPEGGLRDVFLVRARIVRGTVLDRVPASNLTNTPGAEERGLVVSGEHAAFLGVTRDHVESVTVLSLRGEPASRTAGFGAVSRGQLAITQALETGRFTGVGRQRFTVEAKPEVARLEAAEGGFLLVTDAGRTPIEATDDGSASPPGLTRTPNDTSKPGGITWLVDTVRSLSFVGPEPIAWLENRVYGLRDRLLRLRYAVLGAPADDAGGGPTVEERRARLARVRALGAVGFPPEPLRPVVDGFEGDGAWNPVVDDPFVGTYPGAAPAFAETVLHVDPRRPFAKAHLIAWDPRQVQLRAVSGTREPESASGAFGTGVIPRDPRRLTRLVGAFNGGFQAMHGEFGMMADRVVYLPPKPYAATVAVTEEGTVTLGSFVGLPEGARTFTEAAALAQIPPAWVDFRQNLTTVVEDDRVNPWARWYWGAANVNASEQTYVDRSGLCITRAGHAIYFWGNSMGPEALGEAMKSAGCTRGMHLDMNAKHTQFEYYRVARTDAAGPPVGRALTDHEFERGYPGVAGMSVRGRLGVADMEPQAFPRYVGVELRDFFYLELRPTLPGPALASGTTFDVQGLPQPDYPWAFARAREGDTTWLRIDASRAVPGEGEGAVLGVLPEGDGSICLVARHVGVEVQYSVVEGPAPAEGATRVVCGTSGAAVAALAVDSEGFLLYAEGPHAGDALRSAVGGLVVPLGQTVRLRTADEWVALDGQVTEPIEGVALRTRTTPYVAVLNPDVTPVGYAQWGRIQDSRVRYIPPEGPRRFNQGAGN